MSNLKFWDSVSKTDEAYTKSSNQNGHNSTSINGHYMIKKATEAFGICGIGWGYDIVEERFDDGEEVYKKNENGGFDVVGNNVNHTIKLRLWFELDGKRGELFDFGHTPYKYWSQRNSKWICDSEVSKKSLTDAIKRCLSKIGVCADVFLGEWDNSAYRQEAGQELAREREIKAIETQERRIEAQKQAFIDLCEEVQNLKSQEELAQSWLIIDRKIKAEALTPEQAAHINQLGIEKQNEWGKANG